jgi:hypothetical protein
MILFRHPPLMPPVRAMRPSREVSADVNARKKRAQEAIF